MNAAVGYQFLDDGTLVSLALIFGSAAILFIGTGYIALDTGFSWTGYWDDTLVAPNRAYALYTLYQLVPLVFLFIFFVLEAFIVIRVLGEIRPLCKFGVYNMCDNMTDVVLSLPHRSSASLCHRTDLPICDQRAPLLGEQRSHQRRSL